MLAEVLFKRDPRSIAHSDAPTLIAPNAILVAVVLRHPRAVLDFPIGWQQPYQLQRGNLVFGLKRSGGIPIAKIAGYWTCPYPANITGWNISVDAGTITVKIWKISTGTAHPTNANSITPGGLSLTTGTNKHSTDLSGFSTVTVAAGDIFACEVTAVSGVSDFGGSIELARTS